MVVPAIGGGGEVSKTIQYGARLAVSDSGQHFWCFGVRRRNLGFNVLGLARVIEIVESWYWRPRSDS